MKTVRLVTEEFVCCYALVPNLAYYEYWYDLFAYQQGSIFFAYNEAVIYSLEGIFPLVGFACEAFEWIANEAASSVLEFESLDDDGIFFKLSLQASGLYKLSSEVADFKPIELSYNQWRSILLSYIVSIRSTIFECYRIDIAHLLMKDSVASSQGPILQESFLQSIPELG